MSPEWPDGIFAPNKFRILDNLFLPIFLYPPFGPLMTARTGILQAHHPRPRGTLSIPAVYSMLSQNDGASAWTPEEDREAKGRTRGERKATDDLYE